MLWLNILAMCWKPLLFLLDYIFIILVTFEKGCNLYVVLIWSLHREVWFDLYSYKSDLIFTQKGIWLKTTILLVFFLYLVRFLKRLVNNRFWWLPWAVQPFVWFPVWFHIFLINCRSNVFWHLYLIELLRLFNRF